MKERQRGTQMLYIGQDLLEWLLMVSNNVLGAAIWLTALLSMDDA